MVVFGHRVILKRQRWSLLSLVTSASSGQRRCHPRRRHCLRVSVYKPLSLHPPFSHRSIAFRTLEANSQHHTMSHNLTKLVYKPDSKSTDEYMIIVNPDSVCPILELC